MLLKRSLMSLFGVTRRVQTYTNDVPGRAQLLQWLQETVDGTHCLIVVEATGGLEQAVISDLLLADYPPLPKSIRKRARDFAWRAWSVGQNRQD